MRNALSVLGWVLLILWLLLQVPVLLQLNAGGRMPIDFLAYYAAATALGGGESPYPTVAGAQAAWQQFHADERELLGAQRDGRGQAVLLAQGARPQTPGPYLYPPTLAQWLLWLRMPPLLFSGLLLAAIFGFCLLWLRSTAAQSLWLLLVILSAGVVASLHGGNVELLLLCAALGAAVLLWRGRGLWAGPLLALLVLIKPFYALFFAAFGLLMLVSGPLPRRRTVNTWLAAGAAAGLLLLVEVLTWGPGLQAQTLTYFQEAMAYHWFTLPVAEQTPMSNWNRTPLQTLITLGVAAAQAQALALGLWALLTGITVWCVRGRTLTFPLAFALALVLLYWGRPVGWTLVYLEFVVILAVWPALRGWPRWTRWALLGAAGALMLSHWAAFLRTAQGLDMTFLTLQTAALPWETWVVLPLSWALLLSVALWGQHPVPAPPAHPLEPQNS